MRYVTIPKPVDMSSLLPEPPKEPELLSFASFLLDSVVGQLPYAEVGEIEIVAAIQTKLLTAEPGAVAELTDAEHEALKKAMPTNINGRALPRVTSFLLAIAAAPTKDPLKVFEAKADEEAAE